MIAVIDKTPVSIDQFLDWYPQISENRYELRRGVIVEMPKPRGKHSVSHIPRVGINGKPDFPCR
ncbi:MAG: hypothetical protein RLP97_27565 [Coleofasciculus chthonoplastes F2-STO-03]